MHRSRWTKWYWADWLTDMNLRLCSPTARGVWLYVLCFAGMGDRVGHVGMPDDELVAKLMITAPPRTTEAKLRKYLAELERNRVFKRDRRGHIYCPKMVRDNAKLQAAIDSGRKGGRASRDRKRGIFAERKGASPVPSPSPSANPSEQTLEPRS